MNTLLKGLEKIAASADIPMLVAGDFNSVPGSAAHNLLLKRAVDQNHPVCRTEQDSKVVPLASVLALPTSGVLLVSHIGLPLLT